MRMRAIAVLAALMMGLMALPFTASAQAPNVARVSAMSYLDDSGTEYDSICGVSSEIDTTIGYSGVGPELAGNGVGDLHFDLFFGSISFDGDIEISGENVHLEGNGYLSCMTSGYALVSGTFYAYPDTGYVQGSMIGYIMDGVNQNQGRVSLTLTGDSGNSGVPLSQ